MKAIFVVLIIGILLAGAYAVYAEEPSDCAPEQRTVQGNASSPCLWDYHLDEIASMRYVVVEQPEANTCYEALEFSPFNFERDYGPDLNLRVTVADVEGQPENDRWNDIFSVINDNKEAFAGSGDGQVLRVRHSGRYWSRSSNRRNAPLFYGLDTEIGATSKFAYSGSPTGGPFFKLYTIASNRPNGSGSRPRLTTSMP